MRQRQCVNVYCWQVLFCDISFYVTQLVKEVGLLRLMPEKLSHLCCTTSCNTFVSKSSQFSPHCVIARLLELNEGSFHLLLPSNPIHSVIPWKCLDQGAVPWPGAAPVPPGPCHCSSALPVSGAIPGDGKLFGKCPFERSKAGPGPAKGRNSSQG